MKGGENVPTTKAGQRAVARYTRENYDRINVTLPKGQREELKIHAEKHGESVNGFIKRAIDETIERDNANCSKAQFSEKISIKFELFPVEIIEKDGKHYTRYDIVSEN